MEYPDEVQLPREIYHRLKTPSWRDSACIQCNGSEMESFIIRTGVKQGCTIPPSPFSIFLFVIKMFILDRLLNGIVSCLQHTSACVYHSALKKNEVVSTSRLKPKHPPCQRSPLMGNTWKMSTTSHTLLVIFHRKPTSMRRFIIGSDVPVIPLEEWNIMC